MWQGRAAPTGPPFDERWEEAVLVGEHAKECGVGGGVGWGGLADEQRRGPHPDQSWIKPLRQSLQPPPTQPSQPGTITRGLELNLLLKLGYPRLVLLRLLLKAIQLAAKAGRLLSLQVKST